MKRFIVFLVIVAISSVIANAAPHRTGQSGCINGFMLWISDTGNLSTTLATAGATHLHGKLGSEHVEIYSSQAIQSCFLYDDAREHHFQYVCSSKYWRMTHRSSGKITADNHDVKVYLSVRTDSGPHDISNRFDSSQNTETNDAANKYINTKLDFIIHLINNRFYTLIYSSSASGSGAHLGSKGDYWQFEELKCENPDTFTP